MFDLINKFLPLCPARVRRSVLSPWFDVHCRALRRQARHLERLYCCTRLPVDRSTWVCFVRDMHHRYRYKERSYWEAKITFNAKDSKHLWATFDAIFGQRRADPQCDAPSFSADDFLASFKKKIADIHQDTVHSTPLVFHPTDCKLSTMNAVTSAELRCIILRSPPKSCELDPISTFLLQELAERSI